MSTHDVNLELPRNIERYLAALSKLYAKEGQAQIAEIIVNSQIRVHEEWSYDRWNDGTYGHALYLAVPESIYLGIVKNKADIQDKIREDMNKLHNYRNEFIEEVFLEMEIIDDHDWRKESGLQISAKRLISSSALDRIWDKDGFRVFLSHKSEVKKEAAVLKDELKLYGVTCFVAHTDIHPTKEWQAEIENALSSMDYLVALMTEKFHDSDWTDQEVGFAFGRGVPILSVRLGKDPYGFIGRFQALTCSWDSATKEIAKILIKHDSMLNAYIKAVQSCHSFDDGNRISQILPEIEGLNSEQVSDFISAFNGNGDARGSFGFNGKNQRYYGAGLPYHLTRLTGKTYRLSAYGEIELQP
ncbi:MAG: toll/interleukin-1 receptor domain-containing protein [Desulfobacteria bacterium]